MSEGQTASWIARMSPESQRAFLELTRQFRAKRQELAEHSELSVREKDFIDSPDWDSVATFFDAIRGHSAAIAGLQVEFGAIAGAMAALLRQEFGAQRGPDTQAD